MSILLNSKIKPISFLFHLLFLFQRSWNIIISQRWPRAIHFGPSFTSLAYVMPHCKYSKLKILIIIYFYGNKVQPTNSKHYGAPMIVVVYINYVVKKKIFWSTGKNSYCACLLHMEKYFLALENLLKYVHKLNLGASYLCRHPCHTEFFYFFHFSQCISSFISILY